MPGNILLLGLLSMEETMKHRWHVRRQVVERLDARQRWDQAYQAILQWSLENEQTRAPSTNPSANGKEEYYESGGIRSGLDLSAGQTRDD